MLYGFGERGFKPFRFLLNELEEPIEVVAHATLARMTFEGQPITFWPMWSASCKSSTVSSRRSRRACGLSTRPVQDV